MRINLESTYVVQMRSKVFVRIFNFPPVSKWQLCESFQSYGQKPDQFSLYSFRILFSITEVVDTNP